MTWIEMVARLSRAQQQRDRQARRNAAALLKKAPKEPPVIPLPPSVFVAELDLAEMAYDQIPGAQEAFNELISYDRSLEWAQQQVVALRRLQIQIEEAS